MGENKSVFQNSRTGDVQRITPVAPEQQHETVANIAFAVGRHGRVHRHHQGLEAGLPQALDQVVRHRPVGPHTELGVDGGQPLSGIECLLEFDLRKPRKLTPPMIGRHAPISYRHSAWQAISGACRHWRRTRGIPLLVWLRLLRLRACATLPPRYAARAHDWLAADRRHGPPSPVPGPRRKRVRARI